MWVSRDELDEKGSALLFGGEVLEVPGDETAGWGWVCHGGVGSRGYYSLLVYKVVHLY